MKATEETSDHKKFFNQKTKDAYAQLVRDNYIKSADTKIEQIKVIEFELFRAIDNLNSGFHVPGGLFHKRLENDYFMLKDQYSKFCV